MKFLAALLTYSLLMLFNFSNKTIESRKKTQDLIDTFIQEQPSLLRMEEAGMSPLGRSPVVDVILSDPFYMPTYAQIVTDLIKKDTAGNQLYPLITSLLTAAGVPTDEISALQVQENTPQTFLQAFPEKTAKKIYAYWVEFLRIHDEVENIFKVFSEDEKQWLRDNYRKFFSGDLDPETEFDFFTTEGCYPLKFYELGARIDLARLAACARRLSLISDAIYESRQELLDLHLQDNFIYQEKDVMLFISQQSNVDHTQNADFFIDLGGSNNILTNAGGTEGTRSLALHIDVKGNNIYEGCHFVQGSGFLGIGLLANFAGNNTYRAESFSQGSGFFGIGALINLEGKNKYTLNFAGQSFATFGFSFLWDKQGKNTYQANQGMAQAATSTLGVAFLINNQGQNTFSNGVFGKGGTISGGIGQGGSTGVRAYPWLNNPNLYGGLSFLYLGGGLNKLKTPWLGQGSAYFLGAGIVVSEGSDDLFEAEYDAQGQGLHSAAGLLLKKGEHNQFKGGWGSLGVSGDRSIGIFYQIGGHNYYEGTAQSIGTSRKPRSVGVFINEGGDNTYVFQKQSNTKLQLPETPNQWSRALFVEIGRDSKYAQGVDEFIRGNERIWGIEDRSVGISTTEKLHLPFHKNPPSDIPFDPIKGWPSNTAYRSIQSADPKRLVDEILTANYDRRRQIYETLNLMRFKDRKIDPDLSQLLKNPGQKPSDIFGFGMLWALRHKDELDLLEIRESLLSNSIQDRYTRKMAAALVGTFWTPEADPVLHHLMINDPAPEIRYSATLALAIKSSNENYLKEGARNDSEGVRYAIARGLLESTTPELMEIVTAMFKDPSFYVRRAAGLTALAHQNKEGMSVLLDTLQYETLDLEDNYGENLYKYLSQYLGVDFKLDKQAWINWWKENKDTFEFPECPSN